MVFVITDSVRGDIAHFLLWQGRLKNGIPQDGPPRSLIRNASACIRTTPTNSAPRNVSVRGEMERRQGAVLSEKLQLVNLGNGSHRSLFLHKFTLGFCSWSNSFYFWKSVVLALAYNSRTLSFSQPWIPNSVHCQSGGVSCISSFQMTRWHFNFKRGRLVSLKEGERRIIQIRERQSPVFNPGLSIPFAAWAIVLILVTAWLHYMSDATSVL